MPLYEYQCDACGHRFEVIQKFSDPLVDTCPKCGSPVHKLMSSPAIQFKGSGFYITDYAKKEYTAATKADKDTRDTKETKDTKDSKESKESKDTKDSKETKETKSDKSTSEKSTSSASTSDSASSAASSPSAAPAKKDA
jgi:putative FmdB family regulatory protein